MSYAIVDPALGRVVPYQAIAVSLSCVIEVMSRYQLANFRRGDFICFGGGALATLIECPTCRAKSCQ